MRLRHLLQTYKRDESAEAEALAAIKRLVEHDDPPVTPEGGS